MTYTAELIIKADGKVVHQAVLEQGESKKGTYKTFQASPANKHLPFGKIYFDPAVKPETKDKS